ncbi:ABC-type Fe3+-hydroxamate transport system substrate-binding protein [Peribacillus sp. V2I11]|nr:ABC-type Fe3+-hydroxamate transport system substrate-binding protein [Peribacillus sp. V2I11]
MTDFDNYPEEAKNIEHVSDSVNINAEKIIALKPDAIIAYTIGDEATLKLLEDAGIPVFIIKSAANSDDVYGDIRQIAKVMGVAKKGDELVKDIKSLITSVEEKVETLDEKEQTYFEVSPAPEIYITGAETFQQEIRILPALKTSLMTKKAGLRYLMKKSSKGTLNPSSPLPSMQMMLLV